MKQPIDKKTKELPLRGRGRPAKENPLTPAERSRRYREKHIADFTDEIKAISLLRSKLSETEMLMVVMILSQHAKKIVIQTFDDPIKKGGV